MIIDTVTFTGVDSKTQLLDAYKLARGHNFAVEYGVLVSETAGGEKPRYPTIRHAKDIIINFKQNQIKCALHVCGSWSRKLLQGDGSVFDTFNPLFFNRLQWNINPPGRTPAQIAKWNVKGAVEQLNATLFKEGGQLIVQRHNERSVELFNQLNQYGINVAVLFDASGGRGIVSNEWPQPEGKLCGYAGGFTPENIGERLADLAEFLPKDQHIWIDMESGVRTDDVFDLDKVEAVLNIIDSKGKQ